MADAMSRAASWGVRPQRPMAVRRVLILGGGVAGTTLAVALLRRGVEVEIAEIQQEWRPVGVGLTLLGPALRALGELGLIDEAVAAGAGLRRFAVGDRQCQLTDEQDLPQLNGPAYPALVQLSRPAFFGILSRAALAAGVRVRLGTTATALDDDGERVTVRFSSGEQAAYDLVVGADGVHSRTRALAFPGAPAPAFSGQAVWRAMVERDAELDSAFASDTMYMFYGPSNKAGVVPTSARQLYVFLVENIPDDTRPEEHLLPSLIRRQLSDFSGSLALVRERITQPEQVLWRALETLLVPAPWHRGRIVLAGDAAHTTTPHLASGAGIAIEDAVVLAAELERERVEDALEAYAARRFERCRMVVENSLQLGRWEQHPDPSADPVGLTSRSWAELATPI